MVETTDDEGSNYYLTFIHQLLATMIKPFFKEQNDEILSAIYMTLLSSATVTKQSRLSCHD
eukprot:scaffold3998_cov66-Cylindrotheca_fusiformis.AAC.2